MEVQCHLCFDQISTAVIGDQTCPSCGGSIYVYLDGDISGNEWCGSEDPMNGTEDTKNSLAEKSVDDLYDEAEKLVQIGRISLLETVVAATTEIEDLGDLEDLARILKMITEVRGSA